MGHESRLANDHVKERPACEYKQDPKGDPRSDLDPSRILILKVLLRVGRQSPERGMVRHRKQEESIATETECDEDGEGLA